MKKVYIGIDAHKESNTVALAFAGKEPPALFDSYGRNVVTIVFCHYLFRKLSFCFAPRVTGLNAAFCIPI